MAHYPAARSLWLPRSLVQEEGAQGQERALGVPSAQSVPIPHGAASYLGSAAVRVSKVREGHGGCPRLACLSSFLFLPRRVVFAPPAVGRLGSLHGCGYPEAGPPPAERHWRHSQGQPSCPALRSRRRSTGQRGPEDRRAHGWAREGRGCEFSKAHSGEAR